MTVSLRQLAAAGQRASQPFAKSLTEARVRGAKTAFLCHSHKDDQLVEGFIGLLAETGWNVYVDWQDEDMPERPNRATAVRIQEKIAELDYFILLATPNAMASRWCPWEIGFADGMKDIDRILVCQTTDGGESYGNEYLDLYRSVDFTQDGRLAVWPRGQTTGGVMVKSL